MDLQKALDLEKVTTFDDEWNGEKFSFTAKTNALTPRVLDQFANIQTQPIGLAKSLANILTDWTINMGGEAFPPTAENLERVPVEFLTRIIERLGESWSGNAPKPSKSQSGSAA